MKGLSILMTVVLFVLASQLSMVLHKVGVAPEQQEEEARKAQVLQKIESSKLRAATLNL